MDKQQFECFTLSPLDGRYASIKDALGEYFSEYALVKYRVFVEIQWLKFLIENVESDVLSKFDKDNLGQIEAISKDFNYDSFKAIKDIEAITRHDVKAVEYFIGNQLKDMGYDFEMFNLTLFRYKNLIGMLKGMKQFAPNASLLQMAKALPATARMITVIDKVEDNYRQNMGFEIKKGSYDKVYNRFLAQLRKAKGLSDVNRIYKKAIADFDAIPKNKPAHPLRVGVVGEYFTIMDPYSNHEIEKKLAQMGAEVHRWMNLSNSVLLCPDKGTLKKLKGYLTYDLYKFPSSLWVNIQKKLSSKYTKFDMGSSSISTIALAEHYAKKGFDGLVHVKSFGCTPEMDAVPVLHNISSDYKIPVLYLNYDTQTSDTGIETRLEAFYDMIAMRKEVTQS